MRKISLFLALLCTITLSACTTVKPWERGTLAKEEMAWVADSNETRLRNHVYFSKEASSGGTEAAGGGCGCN